MRPEPRIADPARANRPALLVACSESAESRRLADGLGATHAIFNLGAVLPCDPWVDASGAAAAEHAIASGVRRVLLVGHAGCGLHAPLTGGPAVARRGWFRRHAVPLPRAQTDGAPLELLHLIWQTARFERSELGTLLRREGGACQALYLDATGRLHRWSAATGDFSACDLLAADDLLAPNEAGAPDAADPPRPQPSSG